MRAMPAASLREALRKRRGNPKIEPQMDTDKHRYKIFPPEADPLGRKFRISYISVFIRGSNLF